MAQQDEERLGGGRVSQKLRTRNALLAAARELIAKGASPTVEDAAQTSSISRTTAYRYFRNQAELLAAAYPETQARSLLPAGASLTDASARLAAVVQEITRNVREAEPQQRTMLRLSLDPTTTREQLPLRQGRAIPWIEEALAPLKGQLTASEIRRLTHAVRTVVGIEALVWLTDIAGLSREDAIKTMRWSAATLLRGALAEKTKKATKR